MNSVTESKITNECLVNFDRALNKLEGVLSQLSTAKDIVEKQKLLIEALEQRDIIHRNEAQALSDAAKAQTAAKELYSVRLSESLDRLSKAQKEVETQRHKGTKKFFTGYILGALSICLLVVAVN